MMRSTAKRIQECLAELESHFKLSLRPLSTPMPFQPAEGGRPTPCQTCSSFLDGQAPSNYLPEDLAGLRGYAQENVDSSKFILSSISTPARYVCFFLTFGMSIQINRTMPSALLNLPFTPALDKPLNCGIVLHNSHSRTSI